MTTNTKQAAENALWHALEERRDDLRDLKQRGFSESG